MSITTLALDSSWRDYYANWNALVEPALAPIEGGRCHAPRWALCPSNDQGIIPASGKITFNFHLVPGSIIWGLYPTPVGTMQLTDVAMGHQLFQEPENSVVAAGGSSFDGNMPPPFLLPCPWPVTGEGLFTFEAWGAPGDRVILLIGIAEVTNCPVK